MLLFSLLHPFLSVYLEDLFFLLFFPAVLFCLFHSFFDNLIMFVFFSLGFKTLKEYKFNLLSSNVLLRTAPYVFGREREETFRVRERETLIRLVS